ncbi:hypothetical protein CMV_025601 [Castanea mollissima]|uniref:Uncharacterized protein n=1 Tax=Castanea mollissima TaxID=60419 RepID=A0A8J4QLN7_9ROSI|nr:hypothetical protein CMV_025601 [Castanea mollissima]
MHATKDRIESDTSTVYSISLYESTITTRDEPWFGELKLALGVIGLPVTARDRILSYSSNGTQFISLSSIIDKVQRKGGPLIKNRFQTTMLADGGPPSETLPCPLDGWCFSVPPFLRGDPPILFQPKGQRQGERCDAISLEREAGRACCKGDKKRLCRGDSVTTMNVEEWGILTVTIPMFRHTNATGGVQNRPAEDGRVNVMEPRAREALKVSSNGNMVGVLKLRRGDSFAVIRLCGNMSQCQQKGGGDGRMYSESMSELASAKMIIDAGSSDNIASIEMVDSLGLPPF